MAHYGTLREYRFSDTDAVKDDIRGSSVYGVDDDKLGKIDDVIFDHSNGNIRYAVIDTGGWLHHHKFIVPADRQIDVFHAELRDERGLIEGNPRRHLRWSAQVDDGLDPLLGKIAEPFFVRLAADENILAD